MVSLTAVTWTSAPATAGADEMVYLPGATTLASTTEIAGNAVYLLYSDMDAWMDFQLQVVDDTSYSEFNSNYAGKTDGYAMMAKLTWEDGVGASASDSVGQCIEIYDNSGAASTAISCYVCSIDAFDAAAATITTTCASYYEEGAAITVGATDPATLTAVTASGSIDGFEFNYDCASTSGQVNSGANDWGQIDCRVFQVLTSDSSHRFTPDDVTALTASIGNLYVYNSNDGLQVVAQADSSDTTTLTNWKSAITNFTFASATLAAIAFNLF